MRISDWSSDVCSSDLFSVDLFDREGTRALIDGVGLLVTDAQHRVAAAVVEVGADRGVDAEDVAVALFGQLFRGGDFKTREVALRDEEIVRASGGERVGEYV